MKKVMAFCGVLVFSATGFSQTIVDITIKGIKNDSISLGYYYGNNQYETGKCFLDSKGHGTFISKETLEIGLYLLATPKNNGYLEFIIDQPKITLSSNIKNLNRYATSIDSKANQLFFEYMNYLSEVQENIKGVNEVLEDDPENEKANQRKAEIANGANKYLQNILSKHPEDIFSQMLIAQQEVSIPNEVTNQSEQLYYYKKHFFDNIDFTKNWLIRTNIIPQKISLYLGQLTHPTIDSLTASIDYILDQAKVNEEVYKFILVNFLNKYATSNIMIANNLYAHLLERYYFTGKAAWMEAELLNKMKARYDVIKPSLIGAYARDFKVKRTNNKVYSALNYSKDYLILIFSNIERLNSNEFSEGSTKLLQALPENVAILTVAIGVDDKSIHKLLNTLPYNSNLCTLEGNMEEVIRNYSLVNNLSMKTYVIDKSGKIVAKGLSLRALETFINKK